MTLLYHSRPERWPQFTLNGLLIGVTLSALLVPWALSEYRNHIARRGIIEPFSPPPQLKHSLSRRATP